MVGRTRQTGLSTSPEVNYARRLIDRETLKPPIDVVKLARKFATVRKLRFPSDIDVDGVCLNLKRRRQLPVIIVNIARGSRERIRFTLAHELGHVIIPWHTGSIVDAIDIDQVQADLHYWTLEAEANRFAAELLMPAQWVMDIIEESSSPPDAIDRIARCAEVSRPAAMIRANAYQKPGLVHAQVQNRVVIASGRSKGTLASPPQPGTFINPRFLFPWTPHRWEAQIGNTYCFWWQFKGDILLPTENIGDWRLLLNEIINGIQIQENDVPKFKSKVNGIISYANSRMKTDRTPAKIFEACLERLHSKAEEDCLIRLMIEHPVFQRFLYARVLDFIE
jgi:Zn-dependent peptidase ImmA (M78 family)